MVVGVGLVELERRELGIVPGRDPLVAEAPADLEHLVETADDQSLEVQLGRHPEIEVDVQRVVMRDEGSGRGPPGDRMEDGRLDLDEPLGPQPLAHGLDHVAPQGEQLAGPFVGPQVDLALAVAGLDIGHAVPLVAEVATGLGQQLPFGHLDRELPALGAHHLTAGPDPVAQVEADELVEPLRHRGQREQLHRARGVTQLGEGQLALRPRQHEPPGHRDRLARLLSRGQARPARHDLRRLVRAGEAVRDGGRARAVFAHPVPPDTLRS